MDQIRHIPTCRLLLKEDRSSFCSVEIQFPALHAAPGSSSKSSLLDPVKPCLLREIEISQPSNPFAGSNEELERWGTNRVPPMFQQFQYAILQVFGDRQAIAEIAPLRLRIETGLRCIRTGLSAYYPEVVLSLMRNQYPFAFGEDIPIGKRIVSLE